MMMAKAFLLFAFFGSCCGSLQGQVQNAQPKKHVSLIDNARLKGQPYPSFLASTGTDTISNEILKGNVVFINFWFESCEPCMAEMNALNMLYDSLRNHPDFRFISFTWDDEATRKRVQEKFNIRFGVFPLSRDECQRLNFNNGYPTTIILDKEGKISYIHAGGSIEEDNAKQFILTHFIPEILKKL